MTQGRGGGIIFFAVELSKTGDFRPNRGRARRTGTRYSVNDARKTKSHSVARHKRSFIRPDEGQNHHGRRAPRVWERQAPPFAVAALFLVLGAEQGGNPPFCSAPLRKKTKKNQKKSRYAKGHSKKREETAWRVGR